MEKLKEYFDSQSIVVHFDPSDITPTPELVARYIGGSKYKMNRQIHDLIATAINQGRNLIEPRMVYTLTPLKEITGGGKTNHKDGIPFPILLDELFAKNEYIVAAICSLNSKLETTCSRYISENKRMEAVALDATGVAMLEVLSNKALEFFEKLAEQKQLFTGCRFCPGNAGRPLEYQSIVFRLAEGAKINVHLGENLVMRPSKSISFFVGFTSYQNGYRAGYKCQSCPQKNCQFRVQVQN